MSHRNRNDGIREQSSIFYFSPGRANGMPRAFEAFYTQMFIQDVSQGLLPAWATRRGSKVSVKLEPANTDVEDMISSALNISRQGHRYRNLERAVSEFLRLTMVELCISKRAVFEIVYLRSEPDGVRDGFDLFHIDSRQLVRRWGQWRQIVPPDIAKERSIGKRIRIPSENLAVITLPDHLARSVESTMGTLNELSDHHWHGLTSEAQHHQLPYNFSEHERSMNFALSESCREIGWMCRGMLNGKITSYYLLRQELRFKLFTLDVRDALISQLNAVLQQIGRTLGWSAKISITGLPTRSNIERALLLLESGEKPFIDIMDNIRNL
jgi:hypothetical protein